MNVINGTRIMEDCIKRAFAVINFIEDIDYLDNLIEHFNRYLAFDKRGIMIKLQLKIFQKCSSNHQIN